MPKYEVILYWSESDQAFNPKVAWFSLSSR
jgi:hypothetical protein